MTPDFMQAAADVTGEMLLLTMLDSDHALVKSDSMHPVQIFSLIGSSVPLHAASVGWP